MALGLSKEIAIDVKEVTLAACVGAIFSPLGATVERVVIGVR